ncbi:hypothetical protein [Gorillibacterium sp. sgz5001074]|uniref:hypothetical protein n=1 Tax=Gorillibacterium sp. sgz5001074 TaxID=3446695 RepID=UPI003F680E41
MAIAVFILIVLVSVVIFVLVDINSKLPARDYAEEALWRDKRRKDAASVGGPLPVPEAARKPESVTTPDPDPAQPPQAP